MMELCDELEERAVSYDQSGPSAQHTAVLLRKAKAELERLSAMWVTETRENERLRAEVNQCAIELDEAANLLRPHYPRLATIYDMAAGRARLFGGGASTKDEIMALHDKTVAMLKA